LSGNAWLQRCFPSIIPELLPQMTVSFTARQYGHNTQSRGEEGLSMAEPQGQVVFFDLGGTLGSPRISFPERRLERLDVYPYTFSVLQALKDQGTPCGIISNTGAETFASMDAVLKKAGIAQFFQPPL
jgi:hypothetical protein